MPFRSLGFDNSFCSANVFVCRENRFWRKKSDKQKAVPEEAEFASNGTVFYVVKIISELEYVVNL